jgi:hypothetical protein
MFATNLIALYALWVLDHQDPLHTVTRQKLEGAMPRATVVTQPERFDLETLPKTGEDEGGWVLIRRLSYGEKLQKDQEAMKMRFDMSTSGSADGLDAEIAMISELATLGEFQKCIMDHNLTDDNDIRLDLTKIENIRKLDPRIGDEINQLMAQLNDFEKRSKATSVDAKGK